MPTLESTSYNSSEPVTSVAIASKMPTVTRGGKKYKRTKGGQGSSDYALQVYGNGESQHTAPGAGNQINMQQVRTGGKAMGGNVLNDIAVPAVLLYANHAYGKSSRGPREKTFRRRGRGRGSRRYNKRRSRRRR